MSELQIEEKIMETASRDGRYHGEAYRFVFDALDFVLISLGRHQQPIGDRHVSVEQLLDGVREFALDQFGPLSRTVLEYWGIYRTEDIGEIVFNLVEAGLLNKQDTDNKADFANGFNFREAFEESYSPEIPWNHY
jgi:uncharacterized repeat protein (TIGR04138 family)